MNLNSSFLRRMISGSLCLPLMRLTRILYYKHLLQIFQYHMYLLPQLSSWSYNFIEDVFSHMRIYSTEGIIQQVDISIEINSTCQADTLFLSSTQVNTLKITQRQQITQICNDQTFLLCPKNYTNP